MLDFGATPFPVLEGQSIAIVPPGARRRASRTTRGSTASPARATASGPGYNNISLTIKRVLEDHDGRPVRGVASNYMCDLKVGDKVEVIGPFGASFLMPNHPRSHIVMICTGTGSAPMRAMTEWRRRLRTVRQVRGRQADAVLRRAHAGGTARTSARCRSLPKDFIDFNLAFSRTPGQPKRYVQDLMRERAADLAPARGPERLLLRVRPEGDGRGRGSCPPCATWRGRSRNSIWETGALALSAATTVCTLETVLIIAS